MPQIVIEPKDLAQLLRGKTIATPLTGFTLHTDDEKVREKAPPSLLADLISYLESED